MRRTTKPSRGACPRTVLVSATLDKNVFLQAVFEPVQGYLAHVKHPLRRTLQQPYAQGPMVILGWWVSLMSEVPL